MATGTKTRPSVSPFPQVLPNYGPELPLPESIALLETRQPKPASAIAQPAGRRSTEYRQRAADTPDVVYGSHSTTARESSSPASLDRLGSRSRRSRSVSVLKSGRLPSHDHQKQPTMVLEAPGWLRVLMTIQRGSTPVTCVLILGALVLYGWNVSSQRAWSKSYRELSQLQRQERELIATSESHKHQIVQLAESSKTSLVRQVPANTVFLTPQPLKAAFKEEPKLPPVSQLHQPPLGY